MGAAGNSARRSRLIPAVLASLALHGAAFLLVRGPPRPPGTGAEKAAFRVFFESGLSPDAREPDAPEPAVPPGDLAGTAAATAGYVQAAVLPATPPAAGYAQAESAGEEPAGFSGAVQPGPEPAGLDRDQLKALIKGLIEERLSYPAAARRRNIEGVVDISLRIDVSGKLLECGVRRGSGSPVLDRAARDLAGGIFPLKGIRLSAPAELVISISYALR